jgi:hypothetical protein
MCRALLDVEHRLIEHQRRHAHRDTAAGRREVALRLGRFAFLCASGMSVAGSTLKLSNRSSRSRSNRL